MAFSSSKENAALPVLTARCTCRLSSAQTLFQHLPVRSRSVCASLSRALLSSNPRSAPAASFRIMCASSTLSIESAQDSDAFLSDTDAMALVAASDLANLRVLLLATNLACET